MTNKDAATKDAPEGQSVVETQQDVQREQEDALIAKNQERYDARVSGKSSAEVNADEQAAALAETGHAPGAPNGGQVWPEGEGPEATTRKAKPATATTTSTSQGQTESK